MENPIFGLDIVTTAANLETLFVGGATYTALKETGFLILIENKGNKIAVRNSIRLHHDAR